MAMNMNIEIKKITKDEMARKKICSWPIWSCGVSTFNWEYDERESCYLLSGEVEVSSEFETVALSGGDFVVFPKGLKCCWKVLQPVKKHYIFG